MKFYCNHCKFRRRNLYKKANIRRKPELFKIEYLNDDGKRENIIIKGNTVQDYDKQRPVNENVMYGKFLIKEEKERLTEINNRYKGIYKIGTTEKKIQEITVLKKDINWKFRVLNDLYY